MRSTLVDPTSFSPFDVNPIAYWTRCTFHTTVLTYTHTVLVCFYCLLCRIFQNVSPASKCSLNPFQALLRPLVSRDEDYSAKDSCQRFDLKVFLVQIHLLYQLCLNVCSRSTFSMFFIFFTFIIVNTICTLFQSLPTDYLASKYHVSICSLNVFVTFCHIIFVSRHATIPGM